MNQHSAKVRKKTPPKEAQTRKHWPGAVIRSLRKKAGMSGSELARRLNVKPATLRAWERDDNPLTPYNPHHEFIVQKTADLFGVSPREIWLGNAELREPNFLHGVDPRDFSLIPRSVAVVVDSTDDSPVRVSVQLGDALEALDQLANPERSQDLKEVCRMVVEIALVQLFNRSRSPEEPPVTIAQARQMPTPIWDLFFPDDDADQEVAARTARVMTGVLMHALHNEYRDLVTEVLTEGKLESNDEMMS